LAILNASWFGGFRWRRWTGLFASVAGTQALCQLLNGVVAFLLVRMLSKEEYAWFTITSAMAAVLNVTSDGGIATAVMSLGGKVWQDRGKLSALIQAALSMLTWMAAASTMFLLPAMAWLLHRQNAPWPIVVSLTLLTICPQWLMTRSIILGIVNRLQSRVWNLQISEITLASVRFGLTLILWLSGLMQAVWATATVGVSMLIQGILVRKQVRPLLDTAVNAQQVGEFRPQVAKTVRQVMPSAAFNCLQGQLSVWILGLLGTSSQVAELGALGRLAFITNLISAPLAFLVTPAFSRCHELPRLRKIFGALLLGYGLFYIILLFVCWTQSSLILSLFGPKYAHLNHELVIVAGGLALAGINAVVWSLNLAKGWVKHLWLTMPLTLASQTAALMLLDVRSVSGAALLNVVLAACHLLHSMCIALFGLRGGYQSA
jgi:O-antigen/teichoic acid export membrane protein